jgi:hypothetical protein
LITTSSPNFSLRILFALPIPSTNPRSFAFFPAQNSPENNSTLSFLSFDPLLSSTTSIKSL